GPMIRARPPKAPKVVSTCAHSSRPAWTWSCRSRRGLQARDDESPGGCVGLVNPYIAAASGLRQRMYLADFVGCSLPRFGSIATFARGLLGTARVGSSNAALAVGSAAT